MFEIPILLITFNRPDYTSQVLARIMEQKPRDLYVFQDGVRPGNANDVDRCQMVRDAVMEQTASAQTLIHTLYCEKNLGCGMGPKTAIDWFFQNEEWGIILEDDCLPAPSFFSYTEELLRRYCDNDKVSFIGGNNFGYSIPDASYAFAGGHHQTWGWATWRRTWRNMNYTLEGWTSWDFLRVVTHYYRFPKMWEYWLAIYKDVKRDQMHHSCWDYQFYFSCWKNKQLAICPAVNLVSNIGNGDDATHTAGVSALLLCPTKSINQIVHPRCILHCKGLDSFMMRRMIIPYEYGRTGLRRLPYRIYKTIKILITK